MIKKAFILTVFTEFLLIGMLLHIAINEPSQAYANTDMVKLPAPKYDGKVSIEKALHTRRSIREYKDKSLELAEVSQLLWAAQGITDPLGLRTAPSAGALYPIEVYFVAGNVNDLSDGVYKYNPHKHELVRVMQGGDKRSELCSAALNQPCIKNSAGVIILAAVYERTTRKYGERGIRYVHMEIGHAAQNVYLQSVSLNLGTVVIGAFDDNKVKRTLGMSYAEQPLCIMPIGRK
jgi:SagB-type dehydrogenase family enzyme